MSLCACLTTLAVLRSLRKGPLAIAMLAAVAAPAQAKPKLVPADIDVVLAEVRRPGAQAVLVNVWATWCEPCVEELPTLLQIYRTYRAQGLRLVLVSADDDDTRAAAEKLLASHGVTFPTFRKTGDDMAFINGLERRWSGALPASFLFDGQGHLQRFWPTEITARELTDTLNDILKRRKR